MCHTKICICVFYLHFHLSPNREGGWGTTDDFTTSFLHFFSVLRCPLGLDELQACPFPDVVFPPFPLSALSSSPLSLCLARWLSPDLMNGRHVHTTAACVFLRWSEGLRVVRLPAGSWHGLPCWWHGLCRRCVVSCGSTSFPWLVFFFEALLWGSMIHKHTGRWMWSSSLISHKFSEVPPHHTQNCIRKI